MYDGSAYNKTQKKIYHQPIKNIMFDNFVWSYWLKQSMHIEISTKYTFIEVVISQHSNNPDILRNAFIELINTYWFSKSNNVILVDCSRLWHLPLAKGVNPYSLTVVDFDIHH